MDQGVRINLTLSLRPEDAAALQQYMETLHTRARDNNLPWEDRYRIGRAAATRAGAAIYLLRWALSLSDTQSEKQKLAHTRVVMTPVRPVRRAKRGGK